MAPSTNVTVGEPQASVAVAVPNTASIADCDGLQLRGPALPVGVITGGVKSIIHVTVLETVAVLPHPSLAVNVIVWERPQLLGITLPVTCVIVVGPHASVAVAVPNAFAISEADGLHPNDNVVPVVLMVGGEESSVHVTVLEVVEVFPQTSVARNVLVQDRLHVLLCIDPSLAVIVTVPQASVAVAVPRELAGLEGLHPKFTVV